MVSLWKYAALGHASLAPQILRQDTLAFFSEKP